MSRPAFFVVMRRNGIEMPAIYWDELPRQYLHELVYVLRLDAQPNAEALTAMSVIKLFEMYQRLAKRGKLPAKYDPKTANK